MQALAGGGANQPTVLYICSHLFNPMRFCIFLQFLCQSEYKYDSLKLGWYVVVSETRPAVIFAALDELVKYIDKKSLLIQSQNETKSAI